MTGALNWAVDEIGAAFGVLDDHWWPTQAARSAAETLPIPCRRFHRDFAPKQCCSSAEVGRELVTKLVSRKWNSPCSGWIARQSQTTLLRCVISMSSSASVR